MFGLSIGSTYTATGNKAPVGLGITWGGGFPAGVVSDSTTPVVTLGVLAATDPDGNAITYAVHTDVDNKFSVSGANLQLANAVNHTIKTHHSVTVRATDTHSAYVDAVFTITVTA